ncbi:hypothetical protein SAY86_001089 [Trapa natans]|uniref:Uncharacterized protein n=1 Tax=Trapa natans TaxID=22666 RepID=A0AAN7MG07_TRANT|nr:hypothetical protein SAY86_001089 [Trapa natans]
MDPHAAAAISRRRVEVNDNKSLSRDKNGLRLLAAGYFTLESLFILLCLTASLQLPPFMLLLLPIGILGLLMILALTPSESVDLTHSHM